MYQHGKKTKAPKNSAVFLATVTIIGVVVLIGWWIIHKDIGAGTDPKTTVPIITEVGEDKEDKLKVNENFFSFELPADWKLLEHQTGNGINAYIYVATRKGADDRKLYVHVDTIPQVYKVTRMQPITPNGNKLMLGNVSGNCVDFSKDANRSSNAEFTAKWENVTFVCDPIITNQTIGTGTEDSGIATKVGNHRYFFYYEDHNIRPDDRILRDALQSFVGK